MNVLIDSNILLRWVNNEHAHHSVAVASLKKLRLDGHLPCLVPQNLYEFWAVATRPKSPENGLGMSVEDAKDEIPRFYPPLFVLLKDERAILPKWQELVVDFEVKGRKTHDARIAAAMLRHGLTHILTFNGKDFSRFNGVEAIDPHEFIAGKLSF